MCHRKKLKYGTGHLIKLSECQSSNIRHSVKMNLAIFSSFFLGLDSGSGEYFCEKVVKS